MSKVEQTQIQNRINELTTAIDAGDTDVQLSLWEMERTDKRKELAVALEEEANQQNAEVQQQAQAAQIGGLKEIIRSIRDAVYLKELMDRALGLTENATATQDFNSMVDQAVDEDLSALYAAFNTQLEQRDERFRLLTLQALDVQRQLEEAKSFEGHQDNQILAQEEEVKKLADENAALWQTVNEHDEQLRQRDEEIQRLKQHEYELQQQIANVPAPSVSIIDITPTAASESLSERIAQAKENSKLQLANVKHIAANWVEGINAEGNKEIAHVSAVEHVTEFPSIPAIPAITEQVEQFPENTANPTTHTEGDPSTTGNQPLDEVVDKAAEESQVIHSDSGLGIKDYFPTAVTREEHDVLKQSHDALRNEVTQLAVELKVRGILPHAWEAVA